MTNGWSHVKVVVVALIAALVACKPDPVTKPTEGSAAQPAAQHAARGTELRPVLPPEAAGSDVPTARKPGLPWLDKDGDGVVTPEEREAARAERAKRMHDRFDANRDGKVTPDELAGAGSGRRGPHFTDPAALDTDHDGEISIDELQAGMRDLRMQRRGRMVDGSGE